MDSAFNRKAIHMPSSEKQIPFSKQNANQIDIDAALNTYTDDEHVSDSSDAALHVQTYVLMLCKDLKIKKISENLILSTGIVAEELLNQPLRKLVTEDNMSQLRSMISEHHIRPERSITIELMLNNQPHIFNVIIRSLNDYIILELDPKYSNVMAKTRKDFYQDIVKFSTRMQTEKSQQSLCNALVDEIRTLTGFNHAFLCAYDTGQDICLVSESRQASMASFQSSQSKYTPILKQNLKTYSKSNLTVIQNTNNVPAYLVPHDDSTLQSDFSSACTISPEHHQLLHDIGVQAIMEIPIMKNNRLWGVIICHHDQHWGDQYCRCRVYDDARAKRCRGNDRNHHSGVESINANNGSL